MRHRLRRWLAATLGITSLSGMSATAWAPIDVADAAAQPVSQDASPEDTGTHRLFPPHPDPRVDVPPHDTGTIPRGKADTSPSPAATKAPSAAPTVRAVEHTEAPAPSATPSSTPTPPPVTLPIGGSKLTVLLDFLQAQVGKPYVWGATGPWSFDCSGLVLSAFARVGIALPRTSEEQSLRGVPVSLDALEPGDVLFWGPGPGSAYHDAIYIGGGAYIAAENPHVGIVVDTLSYYRPDFARRIL